MKTSILRAISMLILLFALAHKANSQKLDPIATDRPDQTESPFIVPQQYFQFEIGFVHEKVNQNEINQTYPNCLAKYGLTKKTELRLILDLGNTRSFGKNNSGLNPVTIGFKTNLLEEKGIIPTTSFIGHLTIPTLASQDKKAIYYAPSFRFNMQHTLSDRSTLSYNLGSEWDGFTPEPTFIYTLATGFSITESFGSYVELYGFAPQKQSARHSWDAGFTYLINNNVQLDIHGGTAITKNAPNYFIGCGISFRFKK